MSDLREFIDRVKELGELKVIEGANWDLEIGAVTYLTAKQPQPPALLFDKIEGYKEGYRVLTIPDTTNNRSALGLGLPTGLNKLELVGKARDKLKEPFKPVPPVEVKEGPIMENVYTGDDVDLFMFPTPKYHPLDGGRYIGVGDTVAIKDPDEGWVNIGVHRIQIHDKSTATIFFEPGRHGNIIRNKYWSRGQSCPVAVTCGGHPMNVFLGGSPLPWRLSEYDYIGWWRKEPIKVIKGPSTGLPIPADSEIVLEGEIVPPEVESRLEGPFSEWTGHFSPARPEAVFRVKSILHRNDPIILATLPFIGRGIATMPLHIVRAARLWNELDNYIPGVKGVWSDIAFGNLGACIISLEQKYGGHAKQAAMLALGFTGYMQKFVIVVDEDIDPTNLLEVLFAIGIRSEPDSYDVIRNCWGGLLDPLLSPEKRAANDISHSAMIILACKPYNWIKDFPTTIQTSPELEEKVKQKWGDLLL